MTELRRSRMSPARLALVFVATVAVVGACGESVTQVDDGDIVALRLSLDSGIVGVGGKLQIRALPLDSTGALLVGQDITWSSSNSGTATVDADGLVTGIAIGSTDIVASAGGLQATASVSVLPPPMIVLSAATVSFAAVAGGPDPPADSVLVTDGSPFPVLGLAIDSIVYTGNAQDWLLAQLTATSAPSTLNLSTMTAGVTAVGTSVATVWLSGIDAVNSPISVAATLEITAGPAAAITVNDGDGQTGPIAAALPTPPSVLVSDGFGNSVPGAQVTFAVTGGGGSVTGAVATSDAAGIARVGSWTLGTATGANELTATLAAGPAVAFSATATAGAAESLELAAGDGQTAVAGAAVAVQPSVTVRDASGNAADGVTVLFEVTSGGGSVTGSPATSGSDGVATVGSWVMGATAGANALIATVAGVGDTITFGATGVAGPAALLAPSSGDSQTDTIGATLATPYAVVVTDTNGNGVAGVTVAWTITGGGGSIGTLSTTAANGIATASHTLGTSVGAQTAEASVAGLTGSPVPFSSTALSGAAATMSIAGGDAQTAAVGAVVAVSPSVLVVDRAGNPTQGVQVTFSVTGGGGTLTGPAQTTDAAGVAQVGEWTLGAATGANQLTASATGLTSVVFTATGVAGAATQLRLVAGDDQNAVAGSAVSVAPSVMVQDAAGNPAEGVPVQFEVTAGGGSVTGSPATSGSDGIATVGSWVLGPTAGANSLIATVAGAADTIVFNATGSAGAAAMIAASAGDMQSDTIGATLALPYSVLVSDANGNGVAGVTVMWAVTGGGGSIGTLSTTAADGTATASHTLGSSVGAQTAEASVTGLTGSPVQFTSTALAGTPQSMSVAGGDAQTATVGTTVAVSPSVLVVDGSGNPTAGVQVTFSVTGGGGSVTGPAQTTDASGIAQVGGWTLGSTAGANQLSASAAGVTPALITATGVAGTATRLQLNAGDNQSAVAGGAVPVAPSVAVLDQFGNGVDGTSVRFEVVSGGGSLTGASTTSVSGGIATVGTWTLGPAPGLNTMRAVSTGIADSITFTATALTGTATMMSLDGGDAQTDTVAATLATPYTVRIVDTNTNGVAGIPVTWTVTGGGGSITMSSVTDGNGIASATRVLGTVAGAQTATASVGGLSGSPVAFTATATAGTPSAASVNDGDGQTATVGAAVATSPSIVVTDPFGNPIVGHAVTFAVTANDGSVTGGAQLTDGVGVARVGSWTLGTATGANELSATPTGLTAVPFSATGTADAAAQVTLTAGDNQSAVAGSPVAIQPSVHVVDQFGNDVEGETVTFQVTSGGGSVTGASPVTTASGIATLGSWTLGGSAGSNTVVASVAGVAGTVTFTATGTSGTATTISLNGGDAQTGTVAAPLPTPYSVLVEDVNGNPVAGVTVTWAVTNGTGGTITSSSVTDASGVAVATRVLGTVAQVQTASGSVGGLTGSPVDFTATATSGAATTASVNDGDGQTATVGVAVTTAPSIAVADQFGNPVVGHAVTFTVTGNNGSVTGSAQVTDGAGIARVGSWTLGTATGANALTATPAGLAAVAFGATGTADVPAQLTLVAGDNQNAVAGSPVPIQPSVHVGDQFGNDVEGETVTFQVTSGGGSVTGATPVSAASGIATLGSWTLGPTVGSNTIEASVVGVAGTVTFNASGTGGTPTTMSLNGGDAQTDSVASTLAPYSVLVEDANSNPVSGVTVTWAVTNGTGGTITSSSVTDAGGIAVATRVLGTVAQVQTASASVGGLTGSPVDFTATATSGAPATISASAGGGESATVGTAVPTDPAVLVVDQFNNVVAGEPVTFSVTGGGGTVVPTTAISTNAAGIATVTSWTLGTAAGTNNNTLSALAASGSVAGNPVEFTASATAGAATTVQLTSGQGQTAVTGLNVANPPTVTVTDAFGNPVAGASVAFSASGSGIAGTSPVLTNASGVAMTTWTVRIDGDTNPADGTYANTLTATANGGPSNQFSASAIFSYEDHVNPILFNNCMGCHGGNGDLFLDGSSAQNYAAIVNVAANCDATANYRRVSVAGGDLGANTYSILLRRIDPDLTNGTCGSHPTFPSNAPQLDTIRAWIRNTAPNN